MILLEMANNGRTKGGHALPEAIRPSLRDAALRIISATMLAPYVHWRPLLFPVYRLTDGEDTPLTEQIKLSGHGVLEGKLEWIGQMRDGFRLVSQVAGWLDRESCPHAARELWDLLTRCNLIFGIVEAIRSREDLDYVASLMIERHNSWLLAFSDYMILPPETLGWLVAAHKRKACGIPDDIQAWKTVANAAFEVWDQAEPHAMRARRATSFGELFEATLACFPYYEGSVRLFYDAIYRYAQSEGEQPSDLMRDFRVVEEYRVGALELLSYLGHHLISRVGLFLSQSTGLPVVEAVRKALNAARAEVSVYPDVMRNIWIEAANEVGTETVFASESRLEMSFHLESLVEERVPTAFSDPEVVKSAFRIHHANWEPTTLDLERGWQDHLLGPAALLTPSEVKFTASTIKQHDMPSRELIARLLRAYTDVLGES